MAEVIRRCFGCGKAHEVSLELMPIPEGKLKVESDAQSTLGYICPDNGGHFYLLTSLNDGEPAPLPEEQPTPVE